MSRQEYIDLFKKYVLSATKGTGLFPSVMMAQAILESGDGNSELARKYNNHFGIKSDASWKGDTINMNTGEYFDGNYTMINDGFRVYEDPKDSFFDRVQFLQENPRYTKHGVFTAESPETQVHALQNAGYSTSPNYATTLLNIIGQYNLTSLDELQIKLIRYRRLFIIGVAVLMLTIGVSYFYLEHKQSNVKA